jgi:hypothetical protein
VPIGQPADGDDAVSGDVHAFRVTQTLNAGGQAARDIVRVVAGKLQLLLGIGPVADDVVKIEEGLGDVIEVELGSTTDPAVYNLGPADFRCPAGLPRAPGVCSPRGRTVVHREKRDDGLGGRRTLVHTYEDLVSLAGNLDVLGTAPNHLHVYARAFVLKEQTETIDLPSVTDASGVVTKRQRVRTSQHEHTFVATNEAKSYYLRPSSTISTESEVVTVGSAAATTGNLRSTTTTFTLAPPVGTVELGLLNELTTTTTSGGTFVREDKWEASEY